jgi:hypothetical protein
VLVKVLGDTARVRSGSGSWGTYLLVARTSVPVAACCRQTPALPASREQSASCRRFQTQLPWCCISYAVTAKRIGSTQAKLQESLSVLGQPYRRIFNLQSQVGFLQSNTPLEQSLADQ